MALDPGSFDLREVFLRLREQMLAELNVGSFLRHSTAVGNSAERVWLDLFERFLPGRYRASPAFVVDAAGNRSRQIDIVIYDGLQGPALFPHSSGLHVPIESVYAVLEVKTALGRKDVVDAGVKAASVRSLSSKSERPTMACLVASSSSWSPGTFEEQLRDSLGQLEPPAMLDLGCVLEVGAFEQTDGKARLSSPEESLVFFMIRLSERLRALPPAEPVNLMSYCTGIESLKTRRR